MSTASKTYPLRGNGGAHIPGLTPGPLAEVRVDEGEVEVGSAPASLWIDLLDESLQLLQSGVQPGVHLELIAGGVACRGNNN